jgi:hypothetical protein
MLDYTAHNGAGKRMSLVDRSDINRVARSIDLGSTWPHLDDHRFIPRLPRSRALGWILFKAGLFPEVLQIVLTLTIAMLFFIIVL